MSEPEFKQSLGRWHITPEMLDERIREHVADYMKLAGIDDTGATDPAKPERDRIKQISGLDDETLDRLGGVANSGTVVCQPRPEGRLSPRVKLEVDAAYWDRLAEIIASNDRSVEELVSAANRVREGRFTPDVATVESLHTNAVDTKESIESLLRAELDGYRNGNRDLHEENQRLRNLVAMHEGRDNAAQAERRRLAGILRAATVAGKYVHIEDQEDAAYWIEAQVGNDHTTSVEQSHEPRTAE
jgi:hypothetical protein